MANRLPVRGSARRSNRSGSMASDPERVRGLVGGVVVDREPVGGNVWLSRDEGSVISVDEPGYPQLVANRLRSSGIPDHGAEPPPLAERVPRYDGELTPSTLPFGGGSLDPDRPDPQPVEVEVEPGQVLGCARFESRAAAQPGTCGKGATLRVSSPIARKTYLRPSPADSSCRSGPRQVWDSRWLTPRRSRLRGTRRRTARGPGVPSSRSRYRSSRCRRRTRDAGLPPPRQSPILSGTRPDPARCPRRRRSGSSPSPDPTGPPHWTCPRAR